MTGGATITGPTSATPVNGIVTFSGVGLIGAPGEYVLTYNVTVDGALRSVSQTITLSVGAATGLVIQTAAAGAAGGSAFTTQPVVRVTDPAGNTVTGFTGNVTIAPGPGATSIGSTTAQAVAGVATFTNAGVDAAAGSYALNYSATVGTAIHTAVQAIQVSPGTPTKYVVTGSVAQAEIGSTVTFTAQLADANGAAVPRPGISVEWRRSDAGAQFSSTHTVTNSAGVATVTATLDTVSEAQGHSIGIMVVTANDGSRSGVFTLQVVGAPPAKLAFGQQPPNAEWKIDFTTTVVLQDRYGNLIKYVATPVTLSLASNPGSATLGGGLMTNTINGVGTFISPHLDAAGTGYTLRASSGSLTPATSQPFNVSAIGVVARSSIPANDADSLLGLVVARGWAYWSSRYNSGGTAPVSEWKAAINGGAPTHLHSASAFQWGGRFVDDGVYVNVLLANGSTSRSGHVFGIHTAADLRRDWPTGITGRVVGPDLETDSTYAYFNYNSSIPLNSSPGCSSCEKGGIRRLSLASGGITTLVEREYPVYAPIFALADGFIYYADSSAAGRTLQKIPSSGGTSTTIATGLGGVSGSTFGPAQGWRRMLVVGSTVYWVEINAGSGSIRSVSTSGGTPATRVTGLSSTLRQLHTDGTYLYVNDGGSIKRFALSDFSATTLVANDDVADIAIGGDAIFWLSNGATKEVKKTRR